MQAGLTGVHKISSTLDASAAVLIDGSMVLWGCVAGSLTHVMRLR